MSTSANIASSVIDPRAVRAWLAGNKVHVELQDGREIAFPTDKFPRLHDADPELLSRVCIEARGKALRWEELDEDISIAGILAGRFGPQVK